MCDDAGPRRNEGEESRLLNLNRKQLACRSATNQLDRALWPYTIYKQQSSEDTTYSQDSEAGGCRKTWKPQKNQHSSPTQDT